MPTKQWVSSQYVGEGEDYYVYRVRCPFCGKRIRVTINVCAEVMVDQSTLCSHYGKDWNYDVDGVELLFVIPDDQKK